ncbi:MAG: GlmU family protein [Vicingaceae bacterium]|nr:GlmU family protein [Vicingaceae bacterium]
MNLVFFEENRKTFLPLVFTKPLAKIRVGILTIEEKWSLLFNKKGTSISYITETYLSKKYAPFNTDEEAIFINSQFFPTQELITFITNELNTDEALVINETLVVAKCNLKVFNDGQFESVIDISDFNLLNINNCTAIFTKNHLAIQQDFELLTYGRTSEKISKTNTLIGTAIFIEKGAKVEAAVLNATDGPIYIGKDAEIMEGCLVRGPFALCEHATLKMGAKIYGATTIGPHSKIGGEVTNSVIQGFSNKGHDGFLGNSVIGEWCNLGADTNNSNLKNNYGEVNLWSYQTNKLEPTGLQFCGLIMGDHSKCGINTMFNTGTVVGVSANIFGGGFQQKFIPSFSWGEHTTFQLKKAFDVAKKVMERRKIRFSEVDKEILTAIFEQTKVFRK